jgi:arabinan endo-1,5-alpha-L-arabinosidase
MKLHARTLLSLSVLTAVIVAGITLGQSQATPAAGTPAPTDIARQMGMRNINVHDPSTIVQCGDEYYLYPTGAAMFHSKDLITWALGTSPTAGLAQSWPAAARSGWTPPASVPDTGAAPAPAAGRGGRGGGGGGSVWAPDVIKVKDKFFIFLSTSSFGVNNSAIGVISSPTLNPADPAYKFTEGGLIVRSDTRDDFNCIDPAALYDTDGRLWLSFGSFWGGIKLIELNPDTGLRIAPNSPMYHIAHFDSIEASYIYKHDNYYYLFVNWGMCCRQANSTYNMRIGRSPKITGPYLDKAGKDMAVGGGTNFMDIRYGPLVGNGHAGIIQVGDKYFISSHVESNASGAGPANSGTLSIRPLTWGAGGWPVAGTFD